MANLLPKNSQIQVRDRVVMHNVLAASIVLTTLAVIGALAIAPSYFTWKAQSQSVLYEFEALEQIGGYDKVALRSGVSETNKRMTILGGVFSNNEKPVEAVEAVLSARPDGITINRIHYESAEGEGRIVVSGASAETSFREAFVDSLQEKDLFSKVTIPISALVRSDSAEFTLEIFGQF